LTSDKTGNLILSRDRNVDEANGDEYVRPEVEDALCLSDYVHGDTLSNTYLPAPVRRPSAEAMIHSNYPEGAMRSLT
jgi:hypothetical protein